MSDRKYRRRPDVISADMDGEVVMMDIMSGKYYNLGRTGGEIWSLLEEAKTLDALLVPYENAMDIRFTKNAVREIRPGQSVGVLIGPEGGFDRREVEACEKAGAKILTLGKRILRTETAAISMLSILMYELEG